MVNDTGTVVEYTNFHPFGKVQESWMSYNEPMEFTGKERDKHSTFDYTYFGARYYDADLGVFSTVDPLAGLYPNTSPFAYCKNDPVNYIDPDGRLVDVIADIAFIAYDVGDILYSAYKGESITWRKSITIDFGSVVIYFRLDIASLAIALSLVIPYIPHTKNPST